MAEFKLSVPKRVFKKIKKLGVPDTKRIAAEILALEHNPFPKGKKIKRIKGAKDEFIRLRIGGYRVLYDVSGKEVLILDVVRRKDLEKWIKTH